MQGSPPPPWTIKGVPQAERDLMNAAARRAQMTLGQWLIETARQRVERERVPRVDGLAVPVAAPADPPAAGALSPTDLAALMTALPTLAEGRRCGRLAQDVRRLLKHQLVRYLGGSPASLRPAPADHAATPSSTTPR